MGVQTRVSELPTLFCEDIICKALYVEFAHIWHKEKYSQQYVKYRHTSQCVYYNLIKRQPLFQNNNSKDIACSKPSADNIVYLPCWPFCWLPTQCYFIHTVLRIHRPLFIFGHCEGLYHRSAQLRVLYFRYCDALGGKHSALDQEMLSD